ncbi:hypothetical protein ACFWRV_28435 [Streptomyces sp. NPDC058576]|uniref:hypothetical protein n=1 Tax=Streptomyces sp. NPDC058576 TaxID=3346547 RepID=UPI003666AF5C
MSTPNPSANFGLADDKIIEAKNKIIETANAVSRQSRELADILATAGAGWTGVGAAGFTSAQIKVNEDHDVIRRLLQVLMDAVGETKNLSNANDEEVYAAFNKAKNSSALNGI